MLRKDKGDAECTNNQSRDGAVQVNRTDHTKVAIQSYARPSTVSNAPLPSSTVEMCVLQSSSRHRIPSEKPTVLSTLSSLSGSTRAIG